MSPRPYQQRLRAEAASQTRRRILDAVHDGLRRHPSEALTVDDVARRAGVSRSTIYLAFGGRTQLFDAVGADLLRRSGFDDVMSAVDDPDPGAALRHFLRATTRMYDANRDVLRSLFAMTRLDPEAVGGAIGRMEHGRAHGMSLLADRLAAAGLLRDDVAHDRVVDLLWLVSSFESFDLLATGRARSVEAVAESFMAVLRGAILR